MTISSTLLALPLLDNARPFTEVRCYKCKRLLMKWQYTGLANVEIKCPRCGKVDLIHLSTN